MDCSMHLPKTSPEVSIMHAANKPCSASWLLGSGFPSMVLRSEPCLPDKLAPSFLENGFSLLEETKDGIL